MEVRIPSLGVSMTEGVLSSWLVADGAQVVEGQPLYLVETDKVETEIESPIAGIIRHVGVEGETYEVGSVVAEIV